MPFTQFPPVVTLYNQEIDLDAIHRPYSDFTSFTYTLLCLCLCVCVYLVIGADLCDHYHSQNTEHFHHWMVHSTLVQLLSVESRLAGFFQYFRDVAPLTSGLHFF